ncbi:MAG: hypothetical protein E7214_14940 [Clostridium sp.]|nr:hypothetical protein [Clostridium sp.]
MIVDKSTFRELMKEGGGRFKSVNTMGKIEYGYKEIKCGAPLNIYALSNGILIDVTFGKKVFIDYKSIEDVKAYNGKLDISFCEDSRKRQVIISIASKLEYMYNSIRQNANLGYREIERAPLQQSTVVVEEKRGIVNTPSNSNRGMACPKCGSHEIQIISNEANMKSSTSLNLNPLKPFTIFNHKKKAKVSKAKVGAALLTGGASLMFTGIKNNKHLEVFCTQCGHRWKTK